MIMKPDVWPQCFPQQLICSFAVNGKAKKISSKVEFEETVGPRSGLKLRGMPGCGECFNIASKFNQNKQAPTVKAVSVFSNGPLPGGHFHFCVV
jgi:hypothetical protein